LWISTTGWSFPKIIVNVVQVPIYLPRVISNVGVAQEVYPTGVVSLHERAHSGKDPERRARDLRVQMKAEEKIEGDVQHDGQGHDVVDDEALPGKVAADDPGVLQR